MGHGMLGFGFGGGIMMIVFWGILVLFAFMLYKGVFDIGRSAPAHLPSWPEPEEIIRQRYAKGEIDRAEYEELRKTL